MGPVAQCSGAVSVVWGAGLAVMGAVSGAVPVYEASATVA